MEELLAAMAAAVDTANESFSNSGSSVRGKGHGTTKVVAGSGDEEHTLSSNWANNTSSSSNVVLPDRIKGS